MEQETRFIITMVLVLVIAVVLFQFTRPSVQQPQQTQRPSQGRAAQQPQRAEKPPPSPPQPPPGVEVSGPTGGRVRDKDGAMLVDWKRRFGALTSVSLAHTDTDGRYLYPAPGEREKPLTLFTAAEALAPLTMFAGEKPVVGIWSAETDGRSVTFTGPIDEGLRCTKVFRVSPTEKFRCDVEVTLENVAKHPRAVRDVWIVLSSTVGRESGRSGYCGAVYAVRSGEGFDLEDLGPGDVEEAKPEVFEKHFTFAGLQNKYFAAIAAPLEGDWKVNALKVRRLAGAQMPGGADEEKVVPLAVLARFADEVIPPGGKVSAGFLVYWGPKDPDALSHYSDRGFDGLVSYGIFGILSRIFLAIMQGVYWLLPNWGVAIIVLTLIVRAALHPVSRKQQVALMRYQAKVREIQPELEKLKKKYRGDRRRLNEETLKLFRKNKVPLIPAGGCLLMILQIPVFIGLYQALNRSILLRQSSFLWIADLASPDRLFKMPFSLPVLGPYFNLLPILTLVVMIAQQKLQAAVAPAAQQQGKFMTYFMYIFLSVVFYALPSGLVLYFLISTSVGLLEARLVRGYMRRAHPELVASPTQET